MYKSKLLIAVAIFILMASLMQAQADPSSSATNATGQPAAVQVLSAGQMAKADAEILVQRQKEIAASAELNGYDLHSGT